MPIIPIVFINKEYFVSLSLVNVTTDLYSHSLMHVIFFQIGQRAFHLIARLSSDECISGSFTNWELNVIDYFIRKYGTNVHLCSFVLSFRSTAQFQNCLRDFFRFRRCPSE